MKFKKLISSALAVSMLASTALIGVTSVTAADELPFDDVPAKWFKNAVVTVYNEGIMQGKSDTKFDPTANITRAEVVTAFARIACTNIDGKGDALTFTDTKTGKWYSDSVGWAADNEIVKGRGDGRFSPSDNITRAELASIIINFVNYMELKLPDNPKIDSFTDASTFANWMKEPVEAVRKTGLMQGVDGKFNPKGNATRAEIAQVIANLLPSVGRVNVVEDGKTDYVIVIDTENAGAVDAAERLRYQIEYTTGAELDIVDDSTKEISKEIVIGETNRVSGINLGYTSEDDLRNLEGDGYEIAVKDVKVFIDSAGDDGLYRGAVKLANTCTSNDDLRITTKSAERVTREEPIGNLRINGNYISNYVIYYPAGASANTMIGVNDLVEYIEKATNIKLEAIEGTGSDARFAIIIEEKTVYAVGAGNDLDSFTVKSEGNNIRIIGSAERGAMYACYEFLEQIGWRFLTPNYEYFITPDVRDANGHTTRDIKNLDITEYSVFENRRIYADTFNSSRDMKNKLRDINGREYTGNNCHTFDGLDGSFSSQSENQPCLTNEEVYQLMLQNVMALLDNNPDAKLISVSQNDNINYCKCENCMASYAKYTKDPDDPEAGGTAGNMIEFVNRIGAEVAKKYPDVLIHTFAYTYTRHAPQGIKPADNIVIQLCSIECCFNHGLDSTCGLNSGFAQDIKDWSTISKTLYVWDYNNNFGYRATPFSNLEYNVLADNLRLFADNNVRGLFLQGNGSYGENGEFDRLRWYLEAKLAWDPYMSEEEYNTHMKEFMMLYYGNGWEKVYTAMTTFNEKFDKQHLCVYDSIRTNWMSTVLREDIGNIVKLMDEAKLLSESKAQFEHIDCSQIQFDYVYLDANFDKWYDSTDPAVKELVNEYGFALQAKMKKYGTRFSDSYPVPELTEITAPPSDWKALMDVQMGLD